MDWLSEHIGSMGYMGDYYVPNSINFGNGIGAGRPTKRIVGQEQIRPSKNSEPTKKKNTESDFTRIQRFFTWEQFLDYADWHGKNSRRASQRTDVYNYTHTHNFQEAMDLARYGWPEGLQKTQDMDKKVLFTPHEQMGVNFNQDTVYDVAGGSVNIGRYLMGMPDCMRHIKIPQTHNFPCRIQKIFFICSVHAGTNTDEILNHGYKVYQIIEALEQVNIQTELFFATSSNKKYMEHQQDYYFFETYIKLKNSEDIIYPEKIIFPLAHPSMFRRLVLSTLEREPFFTRQIFGFYSGGDYGSWIESWMPPPSLTRDALIIPGYHDQAEMEKVIDRVQSMIKSQYDTVRD